MIHFLYIFYICFCINLLLSKVTDKLVEIGIILELKPKYGNNKYYQINECNEMLHVYEMMRDADDKYKDECKTYTAYFTKTSKKDAEIPINNLMKQYWFNKNGDITEPVNEQNEQKTRSDGDKYYDKKYIQEKIVCNHGSIPINVRAWSQIPTIRSIIPQTIEQERTERISLSNFREKIPICAILGTLNTGIDLNNLPNEFELVNPFRIHGMYIFFIYY